MKKDLIEAEARKLYGIRKNVDVLQHPPPYMTLCWDTKTPEQKLQAWEGYIRDEKDKSAQYKARARWWQIRFWDGSTVIKPAKAKKNPYATPWYEKLLLVVGFCALPFHAPWALALLVVLTVMGWQRKFSKVADSVEKMSTQNQPWKN